MYCKCLRYLSRCYHLWKVCLPRRQCALCTFQSLERCWCINCGSEVSRLESDEIAVVALEEVHKRRISYLDEMKKMSLCLLPSVTQKVKKYYYKTKTSSTWRVYYIVFLRTKFFALREHV